jgi:glycosyltransferase involved in cell wall biosynthesis
MTKARVAAIVPAFNEAERISAVLDAIKSAKLVDEIVVVSDGSTDGTYELVSVDPGVKAVQLETNRGKGGAMRAGAENTDADVILFLDADLTGMDGEKVDMIVEPVIDGSADMAIGIFKSGRRSTDLAQFISPYISGQRAMRRDVFVSIPKLETARSGVETAITKFFRRHKLRVRRVMLKGCTHFMKEEKLGFFKGVAWRMRMYYDITKIMLDGREFK